MPAVVTNAGLAETSGLLRQLGLILFAVGIVVSLANLFLSVEMRPGGVLVALVGGLTLLSVRTGRNPRAAHVLCWGLVVAAWVNGIVVGGLSIATWIAVPVAAMIGGWLLGRRAAIALATVGSLGVFITYWLLVQGLIVEAPRPPALVAFVLIAANLLSAVISIAVAGSFNRQLLQIERTRRQLARAQALAKVGSWSVDVATGEAIWSDEDYRIFGVEIGTPVDYASFRDRVHPEDRARFQAAWSAGAEGKTRYEMSYRIVVGGGVRWVHGVTEFVHDAQGKLVSAHGTLQDITEEKAATARIEYLAYHDVLTALPNREQGQRSLQRAIAAEDRRNGHLAVLYLDLDNFKYVNDTHGHDIGDEILQDVALRMRDCITAKDLLSRLSGDEFMLVLPEAADRERVEATCARLQARLAEPFDAADRRIAISASIGAVLYPVDGSERSDAETLMRYGDTALLEAKAQGDNRCVFFEPRMNAKRLNYVRMRDALRQALDRGDMTLCYQPQVDLSTGRVVGAEALCRWRGPDGSLSLPGDFIGTAEESGLIVPIGRWALREACRQAATWQTTLQAGFAVSVNLSAAQFRLGQVDQDVEAALKDSGLAPSLLELELTESLLMQQDEGIHRVLNALRGIGARLSIDDFGTGYSSLAYLKRFAVDKLKIDQSFTSGIREDPRDRAIVRAIIDIALSMKVRTIAEGVEDEALATTLHGLGCHEAQGYLYSRPLTAPEFVAWFASYARQARQARA